MLSSLILLITSESKGSSFLPVSKTLEKLSTSLGSFFGSRKQQWEVIEHGYKCVSRPTWTIYFGVVEILREHSGRIRLDLLRKELLKEGYVLPGPGFSLTWFMEDLGFLVEQKGRHYYVLD